MKIAMFIAGMAAGLAIYRMISYMKGNTIWTICENCKYRNMAKPHIPCPPKPKETPPQKEDGVRP